MHGLNEGHIAPYTDIQLQLAKYQTYIIMKSQDKSLQLIFEEPITTDKDKTRKTDDIKTIFHNRVKSRLYNKRVEQKHNLAIHLKRLNVTFQTQLKVQSHHQRVMNRCTDRRYN